MLLLYFNTIKVVIQEQEPLRVFHQRGVVLLEYAGSVVL
jgi:hypothetical protein